MRAKILYLATEDWYFVSDTLPLAIAANNNGYEVSVAARAGQHAQVIQDAGLHFVPLEKISRAGIGPKSEMRSIAEIKSVYTRLQPQLLHHIALKPVIYGSIAAGSVPNAGIVNSIMGLGYVFSSNSAKARILKPFVGSALKAVLGRKHMRTIVQNRDDYATLAGLRDSLSHRLRLIRGSGVDPNRFHVSPPATGTPIVVLPARLLRDKGINEFVAAARQLRREGHTARFVLVGEPDVDNFASIERAKIDAWCQDGVIEHWGFRQDMPEIFQSASLVCLPSYREGLPRVLLEAAACGRAIVTTDVPGCREVVTHGENGWLVPARDARALADALREALASPELREGYGRRGRELVERSFTTSIITELTLAVYAELMSQNQIGSGAGKH